MGIKKLLKMVRGLFSMSSTLSQSCISIFNETFPIHIFAFRHLKSILTIISVNKNSCKEAKTYLKYESILFKEYWRIKLAIKVRLEYNRYISELRNTFLMIFKTGKQFTKEKVLIELSPVFPWGRKCNSCICICNPNDNWQRHHSLDNSQQIFFQTFRLVKIKQIHFSNYCQKISLSLSLFSFFSGGKRSLFWSFFIWF